MVKSFVLVWVLLGLPVFYIGLIQTGSAAIFATENIIVELLLIAYLLQNRTKKTEEK